MEEGQETCLTDKDLLGSHGKYQDAEKYHARNAFKKRILLLRMAMFQVKSDFGHESLCLFHKRKVKKKKMKIIKMTLTMWMRADSRNVNSSGEHAKNAPSKDSNYAE